MCGTIWNRSEPWATEVNLGGEKIILKSSKLVAGNVVLFDPYFTVLRPVVDNFGDSSIVLGCIGPRGHWS